MAQEKEKQHPPKIQKRMQVFDLLAAQQITSIDASQQLQLSIRQIGRIAKRYKTEGVSGLYSKKVGQVSNHKFPDAVKSPKGELSIT